MFVVPSFEMSILQSLDKAPQQPAAGKLFGRDVTIRYVIPGIQANIESHYREQLAGSTLVDYANRVDAPIHYRHFGLSIHFREPTELHLHTPELVMDAGLRALIDRVGPVILKNVYIEKATREPSHRNRFPHLNFHIDRSSEQVTVYSLYTRDPFDDEQRFPRTSSTLFIPNIVGYLQAVKEGLVDPANDRGARTAAVLFAEEDVSTLFGQLIVEHRWDEPEGVGELSSIDNRTVLHSSYYRDPHEKGYKIGVRYLAA